MGFQSSTKLVTARCSCTATGELSLDNAFALIEGHLWPDVAANPSSHYFEFGSSDILVNIAHRHLSGGVRDLVKRGAKCGCDAEKSRGELPRLDNRCRTFYHPPPKEVEAPTASSFQIIVTAGPENCSILHIVEKRAAIHGYSNNRFRVELRGGRKKPSPTRRLVTECKLHSVFNTCGHPVQSRKRSLPTPPRIRLYWVPS